MFVHVQTPAVCLTSEACNGCDNWRRCYCPLLNGAIQVVSERVSVHPSSSWWCEIIEKYQVWIHGNGGFVGVLWEGFGGRVLVSMVLMCMWCGKMCSVQGASEGKSAEEGLGLICSYLILALSSVFIQKPQTPHISETKLHIKLVYIDANIVVSSFLSVGNWEVCWSLCIVRQY